MTEHPDESAEQFDSAGQTWRGREVTDTGFAGDDGSADPDLVAALSDPADEMALTAAVKGARFLVPIVTDATAVLREGGLDADKAADMAVAVLVAPDGTRVLPVFSCLDTLAAWDPQARPSPVNSARMAQAAVSESCDVIAIDVASPHSYVLRPSMVWALAMERDWVPAHADGHVRRAVESAVAGEEAVAGVRCEAGESAALRVVLAVRAGLSSHEVSELARRVGERLAEDGETRARIDAITFAIRPAG